jgi:hypothetical protein
MAPLPIRAPLDGVFVSPVILLGLGCGVHLVSPSSDGEILNEGFINGKYLNQLFNHENVMKLSRNV